MLNEYTRNKIDNLINERIKAKKNKEKTKAESYKLLLNSLYGVFKYLDDSD
jgi:DNA polymerase elongation subunit (family B)